MPANKLSHLTKRIIPRFVTDDHEDFEVFIKSYFEYLEQDLGEYDTVANLLSYRDIDETVDAFITQFKFEKAPNLPPTAAASLRLLIKKIKSFYKVKGTEQGYQFLYRAIFDSAVTFYYPRVDVLRTSDSTTVLDDAKIVDSNYWQDFSYEIRSDVQKSAFYDKLMRDLVHPAGLKYFNKLSFDPIVPITPNLSFIESLIVLIISSVGSLNITITESLLDILLVKYNLLTLGHSTGYFADNLEDDAIMSRYGINSLLDLDAMQFHEIEGRAGESLGMVFSNNGVKDDTDEVIIVDKKVTLGVSKSQDEVIEIIKIPKYRENIYNRVLSSGSNVIVPVEYINDKSDLFVFINGFKQDQSSYTLTPASTITFPTNPSSNSRIEWHKVKHSAQIITKIIDVNDYIINKSVKGYEDVCHVFINGRLSKETVDYTIDSDTNTLTLLNTVTIGSVAEIVFISKSKKETFTAVAEQTIFYLEEFLDSFNITRDSYLEIL